MDSDSDCGCNIENTKIVIADIKVDQNGVGEEIFRDEDLFERVKNFYQNYEEPLDLNGDDEDDLLLNSLNNEEKKEKKEKKDEIAFINSLLKLTEPKKILEVKPEPEKKEVFQKDNKKINVIKKYLENLKNGT